MKSRSWSKINKLKIFFLSFSLTLLVDSSALASILNTEPNTLTANNFITGIKKPKLVANNKHNFCGDRLSRENREPEKIIIETKEIKNNLGRDYEFIFFYSLTCPYCKSFAPVLKRYSDSSGIDVRGFVLGGNSINQGSEYFPDSTMINPEVIEHFFGKGQNIAVPTLFIMNKKNIHAYPVSRGALTYLELARRMDELGSKVLSNEAAMAKKIENMAGQNHVQ